MAATGHGNARDLKPCYDADTAVERITELYDTAVNRIRERHRRFAAGDHSIAPALDACYPYVGIEVGPEHLVSAAWPIYGSLRNPGVHGITVTRPDIFGDYYREQIALLIANHQVPVVVGVSDQPIPLPFVVEEATADVGRQQIRDMESVFFLPNLGQIDDAIVNSTYRTPSGQPYPLSLFPARRVDLALQRLHHYTATDPQHFQGFVLFTNYQRYVDDFIVYGRQQIEEGDEYTAFIEPGDIRTTNPRFGDSPALGDPPQPPAADAGLSSGA